MSIATKTNTSTEEWARAKLYAIDAYTLGPEDRAWYHSKANDICRWDSTDLARALSIIRRTAAARARKQRQAAKRRRK